jgi:hypothetical protein
LRLFLQRVSLDRFRSTEHVRRTIMTPSEPKAESGQTVANLGTNETSTFKPTPNRTQVDFLTGDGEEKELSRWDKVYNVLTYCPPRCRWNPDKPPQFSMSMNVLFAFAAGFTVANLYYNHPILNILAQDFGVRYEQVAQIPTVMQAGYAAGLLFLCPLGDLVPRRPFVCGLVFFTATLW